MNENTLTGKQRNVTPITGLRGIACICIVCYHYFCLYQDDMGLGLQAAPFAPGSEMFFAYSKNAVELFFMISGFLTAFHYREKVRDMSVLDYIKKRYGKLIFPSLIVTLWALMNNYLALHVIPMDGAYIPAATPLRTVLSVLMINTGWFTSYGQTGLPINSTMWFIDVLLLCYILYYLIRRLCQKTPVYIAVSVLMVLLGYMCLESSPKLPFLWSFNGRGYATFFLGVLLWEFQERAGEKIRTYTAIVWSILILLMFLIRLVVGFEPIFGRMGSSSYVRYFEFFVCPGLILAALNLRPAERVLSVKPMIWLGALSGAMYYVHNNVMEDIRLLHALLGRPFSFSDGSVFLLVLILVLPCAIFWQYLADRLRGLVRRKPNNPVSFSS